MPTIDVTNAAQQLLTMSLDGYAPGRNKPGMCLRWNYFAGIGNKPAFTPAATAADAWNYSTADQKMAMPANGIVPAGYLGYLGATSGPRWAGDTAWTYGDVVTSDGTGLWAQTDFRTLGVIGKGTIEERARQIGRPIIGVLKGCFGYDFVSGSAPAPAPDPTTPEEDMSYAIVPVAPQPGGPLIVVSLERGTSVQIQQPSHVGLLQRYKKNNSDDTMLQVEVDIVKSYLNALVPKGS